MSSLGYRPNNDHIAERPRPKPVVLTVEEPVRPKTMMGKLKDVPCFTCMLGVPRGLIPTLFYSALFFMIPYLFLYETYDWKETDVRIGVLATSAIAATSAVYANDCCCWYNMALLFHTAVEVKVIDVSLTFAYEDGTSDRDMALAVVGSVVVIVHLIPFFLTDRIMLLAILAYAGVIVNAALSLYVDPSLLLLTFLSSMALLVLTMVVGGICEVRTSLLSLLLEAVNRCKLITCSRFEI